MATHSSILAWRIPCTERSLAGYSAWGCKESDMTERLTHGHLGESESHSVVSDSLQPHGLYSLWNPPGQNTGVGSLSLLRWIFPGQESNQGLLHCRCIPYQLSYKGLKFCQKTRFYVRCVHQKIIIKRKILEAIVMIGHRLWCSFTGIYLPPNSSSCITSIYAAFFFFLLMWTVFKVFIEFVAILFLFYALVFWPRGMWDLNSLARIN